MINLINSVSELTFKRKNQNYPAILSLFETNFSEIQSKNLLTESEKEILLDYSQIRQKTFLAGRFCAKKAIAKLKNIKNYKNIEIQKGIFEFPVITYPQMSNVQISIAHTAELATAIAFPESHPIGIDIEKFSEKFSEAINDQLSNFEQNLGKALNISQSKFNLILWSAKESLSKALKSGLMADMSVYEIEKIEKSETEKKEEYYTIFFKNFSQYKAFCHSKQSHIISLCLPKESRLSNAI